MNQQNAKRIYILLAFCNWYQKIKKYIRSVTALSTNKYFILYFTSVWHWTDIVSFSVYWFYVSVRLFWIFLKAHPTSPEILMNVNWMHWKYILYMHYVTWFIHDFRYFCQFICFYSQSYYFKIMYAKFFYICVFVSRIEKVGLVKVILLRRNCY